MTSYLYKKTYINYEKKLKNNSYISEFSVTKHDDSKEYNIRTKSTRLHDEENKFTVVISEGLSLIEVWYDDPSAYFFFDTVVFDLQPYKDWENITNVTIGRKSKSSISHSNVIVNEKIYFMKNSPKERRIILTEREKEDLGKSIHQIEKSIL